MKTPEQFLREVIKYFPDDYVIDTPDEGISIHSIIAAMEEYAIQSVECAKDSIEKIHEEELEFVKTECAGAVESLDLMLEQEKMRALNALKERDMWHNSFRELSKSHIDQANKLREKDKAIDRLENDLTEAVEIMSSIYNNVDKYHLSISFKNGELFDKLKDYLGV